MINTNETNDEDILDQIQNMIDEYIEVFDNILDDIERQQNE